MESENTKKTAKIKVVLQQISDVSKQREADIINEQNDFASMEENVFFQTKQWKTSRPMHFRFIWSKI